MYRSIKRYLTLFSWQLLKYELPLSLDDESKLPRLSHTPILSSRLPCPSLTPSVQFSHSVLYNSLWPHGLQYARFPCPSPTPRAYSNLCPLSPWCHPTIWSSVAPFSSCPQSCPASGYFPMNQLFTTLVKASVLRLQHHSFQRIFKIDFFKIDWFDLLAVQETLKNLLQHHSLKASVLQCSAFFMVQLSHLYLATGKTIALTTLNLGGKVMSLLFNKLSRFIIAFLPRSIF